MVWAKIGSSNYSGSGTSTSVSISTPSKFNMLMYHKTVNANDSSLILRVGNAGSLDPLGSYAKRFSFNGVADVYNQVNWGHMIAHEYSLKGDSFLVCYFTNISGEEKLAIGFGTEANLAGAGYAPDRSENVGKYATSTGTMNIIGEEVTYSTNASKVTTDTNLTVLGSDVDTYVVQDGAVYYETDTNKEFLLSNNTWKKV